MGLSPFATVGGLCFQAAEDRLSYSGGICKFFIFLKASLFCSMVWFASFYGRKFEGAYEPRLRTECDSVGPLRNGTYSMYTGSCRGWFVLAYSLRALPPGWHREAMNNARATTVRGQGFEGCRVWVGVDVITTEM